MLMAGNEARSIFALRAPGCFYLCCLSHEHPLAVEERASVGSCGHDDFSESCVQPVFRISYDHRASGFLCRFSRGTTAIVILSLPFYFPLAPSNHPGRPDFVLLFPGLSEGQEFQSFTCSRKKNMYANDN